MRFAIRLLVPLTAVVFVACSGGDDAPPPLEQRFVTAADAPGSKPDPEEGRETAEVVDEFVATFSQHMVDPDRDEMTTVFQDAGFKGAGTEVRFFGETHSPDAPHVFSSFYELESEDGARSVLDWLETDSKKPCPESCATVVSDFDVDDIPDAAHNGREHRGCRDPRPDPPRQLLGGVHRRFIRLRDGVRGTSRIRL